MEKNKISYISLKFLTKPFIKCKYSFKIYNSEIVPKNGPVIICSNHLHARDQLPIFYSTNRPIHYMAKKEYFEKQPTKTMYKLWGAIPTDRENGRKALETCEKLLLSGCAVGIFPEGTRNTLKNDEINYIYLKYKNYLNISFEKFSSLIKKYNPKNSQVIVLNKLLEKNIISIEEYLNNIYVPDSFLLELLNQNIISENEYDDSLLLPLKYGAVKLAQKTGATLVTSAGNGNFNDGTVNLMYGNCFNINSNSTDKELENYNNEIRKSIIKTYKKIR